MASAGNVAVVPTQNHKRIRPEEITDQHKVFRCTVASQRYPHNRGIVVIFPPGTTLSGRVRMSHFQRGDDLGLYEPISRYDITEGDIAAGGGQLRLWRLP